MRRSYTHCPSGSGHVDFFSANDVFTLCQNGLASAAQNTSRCCVAHILNAAPHGVASTLGIDVRIGNEIVFKPYHDTREGGRRGSVVVVGALQRDGRNGVRLSVGGEFLIFKHVQTPSEAHPASTAVATGSFLRCKAAGT